MAGDWIKMRTNLWDDPRVGRVCDLTGQSEATVIGGLYWLWAMADDHTADGVLPGLTIKSIDRKTGVQGLGDALCDVGWLTVLDAGVQINGFEEHNGSSAKKRCQTAKRVSSHATNATLTREALAIALTVGINGCIANAQSVREALAREEKRREEGNPSVPNGTGGDAADPADDVSQPAGPRKPLEPVEIIFTYGVPVLVSAGTPEKQARTFLGGLRKEHGDIAVVNALRECLKEKPLQPLEWLAAALSPRRQGVGRTQNKQEALEARNRAIADLWFEEVGNA